MSLSILYPCRKAHFISVDPTLSPLLTAIKNNRHILSRRHDGLSDLMVWSSFSSNPIAGSRAFVDITSSMTFSENA